MCVLGVVALSCTRCVPGVCHVPGVPYMGFPNTYCIYIGLARTVYIYTVHDRMYGDFPAKNTVYTPYIYGYGQPYIYTV